MDQSQPSLIGGEVLCMDGPHEGCGATAGGVLLKGQHEGAELMAGKPHLHHDIVGSCQPAKVGGANVDCEVCEPICGSNLEDSSGRGGVYVAITPCM